MLASLNRRQQITEIPRFDFLKQARVLLKCHAVLDVMNKQFFVCKHVSDSLAVKNAKPPSGRPRITTPLEVTVIVTSPRRNRFMAA